MKWFAQDIQNNQDKLSKRMPGHARNVEFLLVVSIRRGCKVRWILCGGDSQK